MYKNILFQIDEAQTLRSTGRCLRSEQRKILNLYRYWSVKQRMSKLGLRCALFRGRIERVDLHGLRCCGYSAWVIERSGRRRQFADGQRNVWSDQGSLKRELRACGVREVYWRQPVSHDEMIGRPAAAESGFGLRMPLLADN